MNTSARLHTLPSVQLLFASSSCTSVRHVVTTVIPAVVSSAFVIITQLHAERLSYSGVHSTLRQGFALWFACYIGFMFTFIKHQCQSALNNEAAYLSIALVNVLLVPYLNALTYTRIQ